VEVADGECERESKEARVEMCVCVRGLGFRACGEARACFVCVCVFWFDTDGACVVKLERGCGRHE
jgi:hypothetical protein